MSARPHAAWQDSQVVDVRDAAFAARTYREQADVRALLTRAAAGRQLGTACDVGAGYGRMTPLLAEVADWVVGLEREPQLVREAARLLPAIRFVQVASLDALPLQTAACDLVLTFTVLQHLTDAVVSAAAREIVRIVKPGGYVLICEETDAELRTGAVDDPGGMCTIGRPVAVYARLLAGCDLLATAPRRIEPTYPRADVGTYLLLRKAADETPLGAAGTRL